MTTDRFSEKLSVAILQALNKIGLLKYFRPMPTEQVTHVIILIAKDATNPTLLKKNIPVENP